MSFFYYAKSTEVPFNTKNVLSENKTNMSLELNGMSKLNNSVLTIIAWGSEKGRGALGFKAAAPPHSSSGFAESSKFKLPTLST